LISFGTNPHRFKASQDIGHNKLVEVFRKASPHSGFQYTKCQDPQLKAKVEKIWSLCYRKAKMPSSQLIAKEFVLGIVAEKIGKPIS
jgi:hypothetical protein